jgi:glycosyltransferase involved in cell wall biosynthesis
MVEKSHLVSVIIPVYNGASFLAGAIENVLAQNYQPLEIIVVDDGSTDATAEIAAGYLNEIRYVYQTNSGPAASRNRGIRLSQGGLIAFLDVDDLWSDFKLNHQVAYLLAHPTVEIVQGLIQKIHLAEPLSLNKLQVELISAPYRYVNIGSALYRKSVFDKVGLFDEVLTDNEDTDWFIRAWENGVSKVVLDEVTLFYRQHNSNMSHAQAPINYGLTKLIKKHLDRCRDDPTFRAKLSSGYPGVVEYLGQPPGEL